MEKSQIFRQYDIRGRAGAELNDAMVADIAGAFAKYAYSHNQNTVLVGRDNRFSSPHFRDLTVENLLQSGLNVVDIGEVITPVFYFAAVHLRLEAGLMITASHNPASDNGFKVLLGKSTIYGKQIEIIAEMARNKERLQARQRGRLTETDIKPDYISLMKDKIQLGRKKLKVVVDCGNGTAGATAPQILKEWGCEVIELYCDSDPAFPNHHPDPVKAENCRDLMQAVINHQADLGVGFDGDGDRLGVVAPDGRLIWGDMLMVLFWREILPKYPRAKCIVEVKCSQTLIDEIEKLGGQVILYKTGHSLIKAKMRETGAVFSGEMSGHMFFADEYYGYDDAVYAAGRLLRILSRTDSDINLLLADAPKYYATPELRIKTTEQEKFKAVEQVRGYFKERYEIIDMDGARILFPGGWGLVRASNTGPELIVRCEGNTPETLENITRELFAYLNELGLAAAV
ncbi:MAG: phosphomannomutase/phosphoglucomutase [Syntrophomonadaceae bacterium]|jgi:phosphomannomutase/phosphomannomutase/phosphoglucomutase|nr:phosphomannomutase/phosphoglucomutase [Syntrophomonadaceae bacterium]